MTCEEYVVQRLTDMEKRCHDLECKLQSCTEELNEANDVIRCISNKVTTHNRGSTSLHQHYISLNFWDDDKDFGRVVSRLGLTFEDDQVSDASQSEDTVTEAGESE